MLNEFEAYLLKEFREKSSVLVILSIFLLIPQYWSRMVFLFLLTTVFLPSDVHRGKVRLLTSLPFSKEELFWFSYTLLLVLMAITQFIGGAIFGMNFFQIFRDLCQDAVFSTAYFSVAMLSVSFGFGNVGIPFLVFVADILFGSLGSGRYVEFTNVYAYLSPTYQQSGIASAIFSFGLLSISYVYFVKRGYRDGAKS